MKYQVYVVNGKKEEINETKSESSNPFGNPFGDPFGDPNNNTSNQNTPNVVLILQWV